MSFRQEGGNSGLWVSWVNRRGPVGNRQYDMTPDLCASTTVTFRPRKWLCALENGYVCYFERHFSTIKCLENRLYL